MSKLIKPEKKQQDENFPAYPHYPADEDIYKNSEQDGESLTDEDDTSILEGGLDVPGAELDDEMENIGEEDEENNYYSLGGDNHEDLEENRD